MNDFYNPEHKFNFNNEISQDYRFLCKRIANLERELAKDLYEFDLNELEHVMEYLSPQSIGQARAYSQFLNRYLNFSKKHKLLKTNFMDSIKETYGSKENWLKQFVIEENFLINHKTLLEIEAKALNFQDAATCHLFFIGLKHEDILELTMDHVKDDSIYVNGRVIPIDNHTFNLINKAWRENKYNQYYEEGKPAKIPSREFREADKDYVIKACKTGGHKVRTNKMLMDRVSNATNFAYGKRMTATDIIHSGMIYTAWVNYFGKGYEKERLTTDQIQEIAEIFGHYSSGGLRDFINKTFAERLYGYESSGPMELPPFTKDKPMFQWWKVKEANGAAGEEIAKKKLPVFLKLNSIQKMVDSTGYDFEGKTHHTTYRIEVKTITSLNSRIFLTKNEVLKAFDYQDEYWLCLVFLEDKEQKLGKCILRQNPIRLLQIEQLRLSSSISLDFDITPETYSFCARDICSLLEISDYF